MPKSEFCGYSRWSKAVEHLVNRAVRLFRGSDSGAAMVEYLIVVGFVSLVAILGFYKYGRSVHSHLKVEASHIEGKGMPGGGGISDALELLDALGAMPEPFSPEDLIENLTGGGLDSFNPTGTNPGTSSGSSGG
jgi:Flp pilus assembly pilin Flp